MYLTRGDLITVKRVCDQISSASAGRKAHLIVVPMVFQAVEVLIEEEGLYGKVDLHSFQWELVSLDTRVFSFECPEITKFSFVSKDETYINPCAKSLWSLEHIFGKVKFKMFLGSYSRAVGSVMAALDESVGEPDSLDSDVGFLLVVDRDVDFASALLIPGTYTSLVADVVGIDTGIVQVLKSEGSEGAATMALSSEDETYNQIKHKHFSDVILFLKRKISDIYAEQAKRNNMTIQEMRNFVKNDLSKAANTGKILSNHLHICEKVTNKIGKLFEGIQECQHDILMNTARKESITFIEDLIATSGDMNLVLRLLCLLSLCQNGLTQHEATSLKYQFFHAYGHEHLVTFYHLEKMGLFSVAAAGVDSSTKLASKVVQAVTMPRRSVFQTTAAKLKLFPDVTEDYSVKDPQDSGYVFGGIYIPLIVQVVSTIIKKEKTLRELLKCLPSDYVDGFDVVIGRSLDSVPDVNPRCVWVYVVGGITYAEIAAFALLEKKTGCRIVCSGSSIINGNSLIQGAL